MLARHGAHVSGEIVKLNEYTLWKGHLLTLEQELKISPSIKYVLYPDENKAAGWYTRLPSYTWRKWFANPCDLVVQARSSCTG
jgi:hypothetical protein